MRLEDLELVAWHKAAFATSVEDHDLDIIRNDNFVRRPWEPVGWRTHSNKQSQGLVATATAHGLTGVAQPLGMAL
jgi:hypothetical protein